jgi:hypothetical protein
MKRTSIFQMLGIVANAEDSIQDCIVQRHECFLMIMQHPRASPNLMLTLTEMLYKMPNAEMVSQYTRTHPSSRSHQSVLRHHESYTILPLFITLCPLTNPPLTKALSPDVAGLAVAGLA